ncbi:MAG: iron-containing alcohol dehydrogenase [Pseudomonadota bacterium]
MRTISFSNPGKLVFGEEAFAALKADLSASGLRRLYIVSIKPLESVLTELENTLAAAGIEVMFNYSIVEEPTFAEFEDILEVVRSFKADGVIGIGGGSVLDVAKLLAAQIHGRQSIDEIVGIGNLAGRDTYLACVPTTSGTGSEVSPNALFTSDDGSKLGVISPHLVPDAAYVCPELTVSVPAPVTAATGIDAFTHCLEAYANNYAHPMADVLAIKGLEVIARNLVTACRNPKDIDARTQVALGSVYGGMCLGPVNTGAVHALAYPLGTEFHIPHGLSNALLLPYVMDFNLPAATREYAEVANAIGAPVADTTLETARNGIQAVRQLIADCEIPARLSDVSIPRDAIPRMAEGAIQVQRLLKNNPREVTLDDAVAIYTAAY